LDATPRKRKIRLEALQDNILKNIKTKRSILNNVIKQKNKTKKAKVV